MVWCAALDDEASSGGRGHGYRIDQQAIAGFELKFPGTIHFFVAGKRNSPWVEGSVFRRARKVEDIPVLMHDANKEAVDLRGIRLGDFPSQPGNVFVWQLRKQLRADSPALPCQRPLQIPIQVSLQP